jgi:spore coat protein U-like protein
MFSRRTNFMLVAGIATVSSPAIAATSAGVLTVQATVVDACAVASTTLAFGVIDPAIGTTGRPSVGVNVTCTQGTTFAVGLGDGVNASAGQRRMRGATGAHYINYELYRDSGGTQRFGDNVTTQRLAGLTGLGAAANSISVYGGVAPGQSAPADSYSDTVPITIYY